MGILEKILTHPNPKNLFNGADVVRIKNKGDGVHLRGLIEISNICARNCLYCGIRRDNTQVNRYRLEPDEIIETALAAHKTGFKTVVLQSGESDVYTHAEMEKIIKTISKQHMAVTLSLGEKTDREYEDYKRWGARRYLLRIETTDPELYSNLHPDGDLENRKKCLWTIKNLGFETGTGILVGLPGQTVKSIEKDMWFVQSLKPEMVGLGPFIPCENTPLAGQPAGDLDLVLRLVAFFRVLLPTANIPATTAMEAMEEGARKRALSVGANVIMPNITPPAQRKKYLLYPTKPAGAATIQEAYDNAVRELSEIGRTAI